jgi:hypothetical protein
VDDDPSALRPIVTSWPQLAADAGSEPQLVTVALGGAGVEPAGSSRGGGINVGTATAAVSGTRLVSPRDGSEPGSDQPR